MENPITNEFMQDMLARSKTYSLMILRTGPNWNQPGMDKIIWEHGRRNFELRAKGVLPIVCPVTDGGDIKGIGIFDGNLEATRSILDQDPGVQAGIFVYEVHPCRAFPGDSLPE
jgi:hypothetical protein